MDAVSRGSPTKKFKGESLVTKPLTISNALGSVHLGTKYEESNLEGQEHVIRENVAGFDRDMEYIKTSEHLEKDITTGDIYMRVDAVISPGKKIKGQGVVPDKFSNEWVERHEDLDHEHYKEFEKEKYHHMANVGGVYLTSKPLHKGHVGLNKVNPILERIRKMKDKSAAHIQMQWKYYKSSSGEAITDKQEKPDQEPVLVVKEDKPILIGEELITQNIGDDIKFSN